MAARSGDAGKAFSRSTEAEAQRRQVARGRRPQRRIGAREETAQVPTDARLVAAHAEPFDDIDTAELEPLLGRIGDARIVLLGEASHGTDEFYRMRARITQELIDKKGFEIVAVEADWPDAKPIDDHVRHAEVGKEWEAFARFPTWMWRNTAVHDFVEWLREHNRDLSWQMRVGFYGLDLYSLHRSIHAVIEYLQERDPEAANIARARYGCFSPWEEVPQVYGRMAVTDQSCEEDVAAMLTELLRRRLALEEQEDGASYFDAERNARVVQGAERYYRTMCSGSRSSWNLRDSHMFDTLQALLAHHGPDAKAVVWAHNSHLGDARATEMARRGEHNLGQLCKQQYGADCYSIGFGTDHGTVAAASDWDSPMEVKRVRPSHDISVEHVCHLSGVPRFFLPLQAAELRDALTQPRLERAIGVIYRPETELQSHYFQAVLPEQFDEWVWFDESHAVEPLPTIEKAGMPETYPFGV